MVKKGKAESFFQISSYSIWKVSIKTNVIYQQRTNVKALIFNYERFQDVVIDKNYSCRPVNLQRIPVSLCHAKARNPRHGRHELHSLDSGFPAKICDPFSWTISEGASAASSALRTNLLRHMAKKRSRSVQEKTRNTSPAPDGREKSKSIQGSRRNSRFSPQTKTTTLSTHSVKRDLKSTRIPSKGSTGNKHHGAKESTKRKHF